MMPAGLRVLLIQRAASRSEQRLRHAVAGRCCLGGGDRATYRPSPTGFAFVSIALKAARPPCNQFTPAWPTLRLVTGTIVRLPSAACFGTPSSNELSPESLSE